MRTLVAWQMGFCGEAEESLGQMTGAQRWVPASPDDPREPRGNRTGRCKARASCVPPQRRQHASVGQLRPGAREESAQRSQNLAGQSAAGWRRLDQQDPPGRGGDEGPARRGHHASAVRGSCPATTTMVWSGPGECVAGRRHAEVSPLRQEGRGRTTPAPGEGGPASGSQPNCLRCRGLSGTGEVESTCPRGALAVLLLQRASILVCSLGKLSELLRVLFVLLELLLGLLMNIWL